MNIKNLIRKISLYKQGTKIERFCEISSTKMGRYTNFAHHCSVNHAVIGDRTSVGRYTKIAYAKIGKYCSISWDVTIGALGHPVHTISTHAFSYRKQFGLSDKDINIPHKDVIIENDVWIGTGAIIRSGVHIGTGAIIGAGAVVTKDVGPYEIFAGVPAKRIGFRFDEEVRNMLLNSKWWDYPDNQIKEKIELFMPDCEVKSEEMCKSILDELRK